MLTLEELFETFRESENPNGAVRVNYTVDDEVPVLSAEMQGDTLVLQVPPPLENDVILRAKLVNVLQKGIAGDGKQLDLDTYYERIVAALSYMLPDEDLPVIGYTSSGGGVTKGEDITNDTNVNDLRSVNNGGDTGYYDLPPHAKTLQDLIEHKNFNFAQGEIFKAAFTLNDSNARGHSTKVRDLNKIIWYAQRELKRRSEEDE